MGGPYRVQAVRSGGAIQVDMDGVLVWESVMNCKQFTAMVERREVEEQNRFSDDGGDRLLTDSEDNTSTGETAGRDMDSSSQSWSGGSSSGPEGAGAAAGRAQEQQRYNLRPRAATMAAVGRQALKRKRGCCERGQTRHRGRHL